MKELTIYTDGACSGNPGPGGWGAVLVYGGHEKELSGAVEQTTNNRMELQAAISALAALKEPCRVKLHSDSAYLCNAFTKGWLNNWRRNGWKTSNKTSVENVDLWQALLAQLAVHDVAFIKVKGHSVNVYNNRCDALARKAIETSRKEGSRG